MHYTYSNAITSKPNIFLQICTHTQTITISSDLCPPMLLKLHPCIKKLCNVHYPPTPSLGWIRQNKKFFTLAGFSPECFLVSVFPASEKFDSNLELNAGIHKTDAHWCPPMNNNIAPMPTQNPWTWVGMGMGTQCRALHHVQFNMLTLWIEEWSTETQIWVENNFQEGYVVIITLRCLHTKLSLDAEFRCGRVPPSYKAFPLLLRVCNILLSLRGYPIP